MAMIVVDRLDAMAMDSFENFHLLDQGLDCLDDMDLHHLLALVMARHRYREGQIPTGEHRQPCSIVTTHNTHTQ